jgi:hypothetical protein
MLFIIATLVHLDKKKTKKAAQQRDEESAFRTSIQDQIQHQIQEERVVKGIYCDSRMNVVHQTLEIAYEVSSIEKVDPTQIIEDERDIELRTLRATLQTAQASLKRIEGSMPVKPPPVYKP